MWKLISSKSHTKLRAWLKPSTSRYMLVHAFKSSVLTISAPMAVSNYALDCGISFNHPITFLSHFKSFWETAVQDSIRPKTNTTTSICPSLHYFVFWSKTCSLKFLCFPSNKNLTFEDVWNQALSIKFFPNFILKYNLLICKSIWIFFLCSLLQWGMSGLLWWTVAPSTKLASLFTFKLAFYGS